MFDSNTKDWIRYYVEDYFDSETLISSIEGLDSYLQYTHDHYGDEYYVHFIEMSEVNDLKKRQLLKNFADIESFMGRMGGILELKTPERYKPMNDHERRLAPGKEEWTLAHLFKDAFAVFNERENLKSLSKPEELEKRYVNNRSRGSLGLDKKYHYLLVYGFRNTAGSHYDENHNLSTLSKKQIDDIVSSVLVIELDLCNKYKEKLEAVYQKSKEEHLKSSYDATRYVQNIEYSYQKKCEDGFWYLDTYWDIIDNTDEKKKNIDAFVSSIGPTVTAFLGEAGTGKTTALRQLEYQFATRCKSHYGQKWIPFFVELKKITPGTNPIQFEIGRRLKYGADVIRQIIKDGSLVLLLDGWNEIRNNEVKNQIRDELNQLINEYDQKVFITDRSVNNIVLNITKKISKCYLHELSYEDKENYFRNNCQPDVLEIVLEQLEKERTELSGFKPIYNLKTPLMLFYFSKIVEYDKTIPQNYISKYIEKLFEREENEQKDADDPNFFEAMRYILAALAIIYEDGSFFASDAFASIGKIKMIFGFNEPDSMRCLALACKMGILEKDEEVYSFKTDEFQDYFQNFAFNKGIDDKVQGLL